jgi:pimeloyl-ACP methyl ester carboxylesterase
MPGMKNFFPVLAISIQITLSSTDLFAQNHKQSPPTVADKYIVVEGHKMHYHIAGSGSPTVIFEGGVTDDLNSWNPVFSEVARFTKAVCYDRMGLGSSEATTTPRSFKQIATELHSLLHNAHIPPPYIIVGHSMAGGTIRAFAHLYKNEIAGMVFLDCMTEYDVKGMPKDSIEKNIPPQSLSKSTKPAEVELYFLRNEVLSNFSEMRSFSPLPDVPVHVFIGQKNIYPEVVSNRIEWYTKTISNQSESSLTVLPASSHYIHRDYGGLVVSAIRQMMFPNADNVLRKTLQEHGTDSCIAQYKKMKIGYPAGYITEGTLNKLGYEVLQTENFQDAIKLFSLNANMYPTSFNTYDSLAEAYMKAGNKKEAIRNYEKSLYFNPSNSNAAKMLEKLK